MAVGDAFADARRGPRKPVDLGAGASTVCGVSRLFASGADGLQAPAQEG
jgi:hypothetical protein